MFLQTEWRGSKKQDLLGLAHLLALTSENGGCFFNHKFDSFLACEKCQYDRDDSNNKI